MLVPDKYLSQLLRELSSPRIRLSSGSTVPRKLVDVLRKVAPNPSNPNFDQYIFENISGLLVHRRHCADCADLIAVFESAVFPPLREILKKDMDRTLSFRLVAIVRVLIVAEYVYMSFRSSPRC